MQVRGSHPQGSSFWSFRVGPRNLNRLKMNNFWTLSSNKWLILLKHSPLLPPNTRDLCYSDQSPKYNSYRELAQEVAHLADQMVQGIALIETNLDLILLLPLSEGVFEHSGASHLSSLYLKFLICTKGMTYLPTGLLWQIEHSSWD